MARRRQENVEGDRLREVHQQELTESRVNEEFVDWLKTKGPTYLLFLLIGVCVYLGWIRWRQYQVQHRESAWAALMDCRLPGAFEDVAEQYSDLPGFAQEAKLRGADAVIRSVQMDQPIGADPTAQTPPEPLTGEQRETYLSRAERLYRDVIEADDGTLAATLHAVSAMQGLAAVHESRGEAAEAKRWYEQAAERAEAFYPDLAARARRRAETADRYAQPVELPAQAELPQAVPDEAPRPVTIDDALRDLIQPEGAGAG